MLETFFVLTYLKKQYIAGKILFQVFFVINCFSLAQGKDQETA